MLTYPAHLHLLANSCLVEESLSQVRHDVRNKLASIRSCVFYLRRKIEKATTMVQDDPRLSQFLGLLDSEFEACNGVLAPSRGPACPPTRTSLVQVAASLMSAISVPPEVIVQVPSEDAVVVSADRDQLELALFCLIDNAVDAAVAEGGGRVVIREVERERLVGLEVFNACATLQSSAEQMRKPLFSTKPGHLGLGLNIAQRLASRWGGSLQLRVESGVYAALLFPKIP